MQNAKRPRSFVSHSEAETMRIAAEVSTSLRGGDVVLLEGDLGAGKTMFTRGIARALGVRERITSPTFVLMRQYEVPSAGDEMPRRRAPRRERSDGLRFVHVDAYRVHDPRELLHVGLGEWFDRDDAVVVIEWGDRVREIVPRERAITVRLRPGKRGDERVVTVERNSNR